MNGKNSFYDIQIYQRIFVYKKKDLLNIVLSLTRGPEYAPLYSVWILQALWSPIIVLHVKVIRKFFLKA